MSVVNDAAMDIFAQDFVETYVFLSFGDIPGVELLGCTVTLNSRFLGTAKYSERAVPYHTPATTYV